MSRSVFFRSSRFFPVCALIAALPTGFFAVSSQAEEDPAAPAAKPKPSAPLQAKEAPPLLVTATRLPEAKEVVGSPAAALSDQDLRQAQPTTLADALQGAPGVTVMRSGGVGQPTSLFLRGANDGHTLLLVDGVRMMDASASDDAATFNDLLSSDLTGVEVLAGPQSPLYGSSAIGGVVTASTPKGEGPTHGAASIEGGSRNTWTERVSGGGGSDTFNWHVGAARYDTGGFNTTTDAAGETDAYRNTSFALRLGWNITEAFGIDLIARGSSAHAAFDDSYTPENPYADTHQGFVKLAPHLTLADGKWEQVLNLSTFGSQRKLIDAGTAKFLGSNWDADWQNTFHCSRELDLVAGLEALREQAKANSYYSDFSAHAETYSAYAQARFAPVERVTLNLGGRTSQHSTFGNNTTWRAAGAYDWVETNSTLRASAGTAFKAPTLAQLYDTTALFGSPTNNPLLRPERSLGFDAGADQRFFGEGKKAALSVGATYFENRIHNLIQSPYPAPYSNVGEALSRGVEVALSCKALQGDDTGTLTVSGSYTYTDTRDENAVGQAQLLRRPWNQAALRADYALPHDDASIGVAVRWLGARRDLDPVAYVPVHAAGRVTADLVARMKITDQVSVLGRIENIFDNDTPQVLGYNPTPLGAFAGVEVKF